MDQAKRAGMPVSYISEIETGRKRGIVAAFKKLAAALALDIDDIVP
jgi:transcriptional regulator with XRE-family HTH domain